MPAARMHPDQVDTDPMLVHRLLAAEFPHWAGLAIEPVESPGTDHDIGCLNVGDPACDLLPAWNLFTGESRRRFRTELEVDDAGWLRGRSWALYQAVVALPYYWDTNPGIVRQASHALAEICSDRE